MLPTMYGPNAVDWASYTEGSTWSGYATARTVDATDTRQEELLELAKRILGDSQVAKLWLLEQTSFGSKYTEQQIALQKSLKDKKDTKTTKKASLDSNTDSAEITKLEGEIEALEAQSVEAGKNSNDYSQDNLDIKFREFLELYPTAVNATQAEIPIKKKVTQLPKTTLTITEWKRF